MRIPIVLDALGVIAAASPATQLMEVLKGAVGRQVRKNPLYHELALELQGVPEKIVHSDCFTPRTLRQPATIREHLVTHFWVIV